MMIRCIVMRNIFIQIPHNNPTGGMKVANQLAHLFCEHGFNGYVVTHGKKSKADWMSEPANCITQCEMVNICSKNDIIIDNTNDCTTINATRACPAIIKIFYSQGVCFPIAKGYIGSHVWSANNIYNHHWAGSKAIAKELMTRYKLANVTIVNPMVSTQAKMYYSKSFAERNGVLCLARKGSDHIGEIVRTFMKTIDFTIIAQRPFSEEEIFKKMGDHKYFLSTPIHNDIPLWRWYGARFFPGLVGGRTHRIFRIDGFGLPAVEAASCGAIVIGYALGGGLEWMNNENSFIAKDRSLHSLKEQFSNVLSLDNSSAEVVRQRAFCSVDKFSKENTWNQVSAFLAHIGYI